MSKVSLNSLGLKPNAKYGDDCRVEVYHTPSKAWFPVTETRNKVVYYLDSEEKVRKALPEKIAEVNFVDGKEPESIKTEPDTPNVSPLAMGLMTNTDYSGDEVEVEHEDKGWLKLLATANKVLYVKEGSERKRMTLSKLVSVRGVESPEDLEKEDEEVLTRKESSDNLHEEFDFSEELFTESGTVG